MYLQILRAFHKKVLSEMCQKIVSLDLRTALSSLCCLVVHLIYKFSKWVTFFRLQTTRFSHIRRFHLLKHKISSFFRLFYESRLTEAVK